MDWFDTLMKELDCFVIFWEGLLMLGLGIC